MKLLAAVILSVMLLCGGCAVYQAIASIRYPLHGAGSATQPTRWSTTRP